MSNAPAITKNECSRCGGTGRYSYNHLHGDRCYGCDGSGYILYTGRRKAKATATIRECKAGDVIMVNGHLGIVTSIEWCDHPAGYPAGICDPSYNQVIRFERLADGRKRRTYREVLGVAVSAEMIGQEA